MSQRECAGFNWPPLSIPAEQPVSISPVTVSRAGWSVFDRSTVFLLLSLFPAALFPFCAGVPAIGVGQPASQSCAAASSRIPFLPPPPLSRYGLLGAPLKSVVVVVGQPARVTAS